MNRMFCIKTVTVFVSLLLGGVVVVCGDEPKKEEAGGARASRKEYERLKDSIGLHSAFATWLKHGEGVVVYAGLPRESEKAEYEKALAENCTVLMHRFRFYAPPRAISAADLKTFQREFAEIDNFERYGGGKFCGGFHPDICMEWKLDGKTCRALFCFGCWEVRCYAPESEMWVDLTKTGVAAFRPLFKPYARHRLGHQDD